MEFGICTSVSEANAVKRAGWDYVEENAQSLLKGETSDAAWTAAAHVSAAPVPVPSANCLVPGDMKITGPAANMDRLHTYMATVCRRSKAVGIQTLVFGSGAARSVPEGFDRETASKQIVEFAKDAAQLAGEAGIMLVLEPLHGGECNIINTVAEAARFVTAVDHPHFQCLVDTYHLWMEDEPLDHVREAVTMIRHVHVADKVGRVAPGLSGMNDYRAVFKALRLGNYAGRISFEGKAMANFETTAPQVLAYLREQWETCI